MKNKGVCSICGKDLRKAANEYGAIFPIDPVGIKDRRWSCSIHLKRSDIPSDTLKVTNDLCCSLNGMQVTFSAALE